MQTKAPTYEDVNVVIYQDKDGWHFKPSNYAGGGHFSHSYPSKATAEKGAQAWVDRQQW